MKRKIIFIVAFLYLALITLILILGLNLPGGNQPVGTETESLPDRFDEEEQASSHTPAEFTETNTPEPELSQSPTPYEASTITEVLETPTQTEPTSGTPSPTSTSEDYPIDDNPESTATSQPYPVGDQTDSTLTPTFTLTPTDTPANETGWAGEWTVFWGQSDASYKPGLMMVNLDGLDLTASVTIDGKTYLFDGILNQSLLAVVGSWSGSGESGNFYWQTSNGGQFSGNLDRELGFCGIRGGGDRPEPCIDIPNDK